MRLVTREQLLKIEETVAYSEYCGDEFGDSVYIKYHDKGLVVNNDWVDEEFPILQVDMGCGNYYHNHDAFKEDEFGKEHPLSTCETVREGSYDNLDKLYIVYSKEDVKGWINKLNTLLGG